MAKIFLDANCFLRLMRGELQNAVPYLSSHKLFISTLSVHIALYVYKVNLPSQTFENFYQQFQSIDFSKELTQKALVGPTKDFEDNLQLHSAVTSRCSIFLTLDKKLLKMKSFETLNIMSPLDI
ncbi:MAG TPA: hypothetical protein VD999_01925 [Vitreimonas sp.]|nr:hypothetical protein [Vitreimonas sp.]